MAVTIKSATPSVIGFVRTGPIGPQDCIVLDAVLWRSASDARRFNDLRLCGDAVAQLADGKAFRTLNVFPMKRFLGNNSTAARRTDGPVPPAFLFPQDIRSMQAWPQSQGNAIFYMGAILLALGYDWDNDFDSRVWFVTVPTQPG